MVDFGLIPSLDIIPKRRAIAICAGEKGAVMN
jgi:hypothetical protein